MPKYTVRVMVKTDKVLVLNAPSAEDAMREAEHIAREGGGGVLHQRVDAVMCSEVKP